MNTLRWLLAFATVGGALVAQEPPAPAPASVAPTKLTYRGKPVAVPFHCTDEQVRELDLECNAAAPCPVFLELTGVAAASTKLFVTGNLHTASHTVESILLASEDEGHTWSEPFARQLGTGLEHIQFFDFANGWISGEVLSAPPKDPFFLVTTDGGVTWRRRPIFSDSRPGAVETFRFETAKQGFVLIDRIRASEEGHRYELWDTQTGGEGWNLQQVSRKPIALPHPRDENRGFRVRADGATKSYLIEQSEGTRWRTVAGFLIDAGQCRPAE